MRALRQTGYFFLMGGIWAIWSIPPLLNAQHSNFQAAGSVIVVWAIVFLAKDRLSYEKGIETARQNSVVIAINRLEKHRQVSEERLNLTFRLHGLWVAKLLKATGVQTSIMPESSDLDAEEVALARAFSSKPGVFFVDEDNELREAVANLKQTEKDIGSWRRVVFLAEIGFLVIGTLQWGYGDRLSEALHQIDYLHSQEGLNQISSWLTAPWPRPAP